MIKFLHKLLWFIAMAYMGPSYGQEGAEEMVSKGVIADVFSTQPSPEIINVGLIIALLTFVWKLIEFLLNKRERVRDTRSRVKSEYWFKNIMMPICIEPLIDFIIKHVNKIHSLETTYFESPLEEKKESYNSYLNVFKDERNEILSRYMLMGSLSSELYENVSSKLDSLDDVVTQHCYLKSTGNEQRDGRRYGESQIVRNEMIYNLNEILRLQFEFYSAEISR